MVLISTLQRPGDLGRLMRSTQTCCYHVSWSQVRTMVLQNHTPGARCWGQGLTSGEKEPLDFSGTRWLNGSLLVALGGSDGAGGRNGKTKRQHCSFLSHPVASPYPQQEGQKGAPSYFLFLAHCPLPLLREARESLGVTELLLAQGLEAIQRCPSLWEFRPENEDSCGASLQVGP